MPATSLGSQAPLRFAYKSEQHHLLKLSHGVHESFVLLCSPAIAIMRALPFVFTLIVLPWLSYGAPHSNVLHAALRKNSVCPCHLPCAVTKAEQVLTRYICSNTGIRACMIQGCARDGKKGIRCCIQFSSPRPLPPIKSDYSDGLVESMT